MMYDERFFVLSNESELIDIDDAVTPRLAAAINGEAFPTICCFALYAPHWPRVINLINVCTVLRTYVCMNVRVLCLDLCVFFIVVGVVWL